MACVYAKSAGGGNFGRIIDHNGAWGICEGPGYSLFTTDETVDGVRIGWTVTGDKLDLGYSDVAYAKTAARYPLNTWHHVIGTFNEDGNKRVKIYINGNPVELTDEFQMQGNIQDDTNVEMGIGAFVGGDKTPYYLESFDGYLDDIKIYKTAQVPLSALPVRTALSLIPVKQFKTSLKPFPLGMKQV